MAAVDPDALEFQSEERFRVLQDQLVRTQRQLVLAKLKTEQQVEAVYRAAHDASVLIGKPRVIDRPERDRRKDPLEALLHLTDWQGGKKSATYDLDICQHRIEFAVQKAIKLTDIERADHPVRRCHLMLGGDLVEGVTVFPGQAYEVDSTAFTQLFRIAAIVEAAVVTLLGVFEQLDVWWVPGNHGRLGRKGDFPRTDNLDAMACTIAKMRTEHLPRLSWHDPEAGWYCIVEAGKYRALLIHGDQMPRTAPAILRKANQWASGVLPEFNDIFYGHVHSEMVLPLANGKCVFVTPSTESSNEYAREVIAAQGRPAQRLHFVDPANGLRAGERMLWLT